MLIRWNNNSYFKDAVSVGRDWSFATSKKKVKLNIISSLKELCWMRKWGNFTAKAGQPHTNSAETQKLRAAKIIAFSATVSGHQW